MTKFEKSYTAKSVFAELDQIRKNFTAKQRSFREEIYATMQSSQRLIVMLEGDDELRESFAKQVARNLTKRGVKKSQEMNLSTEVVALATGATSRSARQRAWKRGRVLDYLRDHDVKVSKTAEKIKKMGGVEKILTRCSEEKHNEKPKAKSGETTSLKGDHGHTSRGSNDKEIGVTVWMRLSDRDEIAELPIGARLKLSALRVGQKAGDLKITHVKGPKLAEPNGDSHDEWSENV
jgi:hypothetical protein